VRHVNQSGVKHFLDKKFHTCCAEGSAGAYLASTVYKRYVFDKECIARLKAKTCRNIVAGSESRSDAT
jgi:hypothetical protein